MTLLLKITDQSEEYLKRDKYIRRSEKRLSHSEHRISTIHIMNSENLSEEIQESGRLLLADGPLDPLGDEPRPLEYTMRKKGERTYAKNAAVDTTFQVKVNDRYHGQRLRDI